MRNKVIIQVAFLLLSISGFARISPSISAVSKQSSGILFTQTDNSTVYLPCQSVSAIVQSGGSSNTITVYYANEQSLIKTLAFDYTVTGFSTKQQAVDSLYEWSSCDTSGGGGVSQTLSISGDTLSISGGNSVVLPVYVQVDSTIITSYDVLNSQNAPPGSPATGDTYLVGTSPSGAWVGHAKDIAEWNGSAWDFTDGVQGDFLYNATTALTYIFRSGNWVQTTGIPALHNGNNISSELKIGTNNARSLTFETNNVNRGRFDSIGRFHVYNLPTSGITDTFVTKVDSKGKLTKQGQSTFLSGTRPYKSYAAIITQTGTDAPTAVVLQNTLGITPTLTRFATGNYRITASNTFTANKTFCIVGQEANSGTGMNYIWASDSNDDEVLLQTYDGAGLGAALTDDKMDRLSVEIRVYE